MTRTYRHAFTLATILLCCLAAGSQTSWEEHTRLGELAFATGNSERAEQEFRQALELAQKLPPEDRRLATSLRNLARLLEHARRWDEAQPLYELLLAVQETNLGEHHPALLGTLAAAGQVAVRSGDIPSANAHLARYVELAEATGEAPPEQLRLVLSLLSRMYVLQDRPGDALAMKRREVALLRNDSKATPEQQAAELFALGQLELAHGSAEQAEHAFVAGVELIPGGDGERSAAQLLAGAARSALDAAEPELAERLANRVVETAGAQPEAALEAQAVLAEAAWRKVRRTGASLDNLLTAASGSPEVSEAAARLTTLLELQLAHLGSDETAVDDTLAKLVAVRALAGDATAAAEAQRQLVSRRRQAAGTVPTAMLDDLVVLEHAAGRLAEAAEANTEFINRLETEQGEATAALLAPLERQRELLSKLKRKKEARAVKKRLRTLKKQLGL